MNQALLDDAGALRTIREAVERTSVARVFGTPISQDGLTVVPVARIGGGGARAIEDDTDTDDAGSTVGGLGMAARPLGVFVIGGGKVRWRPAIDVNKIILGGQVVAVTALLVARAFIRVRAARR